MRIVAELMGAIALLSIFGYGVLKALEHFASKPKSEKDNGTESKS